MRAIDASIMKFPIKEIKPGEFYPPKPAGAKTIKQLLALGLKPAGEWCITYFEMPYVERGKRQAYAYVKKEDTEPFSTQDFADLEAAKQERAMRRKQAAGAYKEAMAAKAAKEKADRNAALLMSIAQDGAKNVVVFDTETTGFCPAKGDELLQISITDLSANVLFASYVKPAHTVQWGSKALQTNGITPSMVENAPPLEEVAKSVRPLFESADVVVGHNVAFDLRFVSFALGINVPDWKIRDTLKLFKADCPERKFFKLEDAVREYCPSFYGEFSRHAHDATTDTRATAKVFMALIERGREISRKQGEITPAHQEKPVSLSRDTEDCGDFSYFEIG